MKEDKPTLFELIKTRKMRKKQEEIEMLKLEIEMTKHYKELKELRDEIEKGKPKDER